MDHLRTYNEDERQAAVSIQSRYRTFQARTVLDKVMRGDRDAHAFEVYDAFTTSTGMRIKPRQLGPLCDYGWFASLRALSMAHDGELAARLAKVLGVTLSNSSFGDYLLALISCGTMVMLSVVLFYAPKIFGILIRNVFETDEGSASFEQFLLWSVIAIAVGTLFYCVHQATAMLHKSRVTRSLKERYTALTAAHTKMIPREEQETLAKSINALGNAMFVLLPDLVLKVLVLVFCLVSIFSRNALMGAIVGAVIALDVIVSVVVDYNQITVAMHVSDLDEADDQAWCDLNSSDEATRQRAKRARVIINEDKSNKLSSTKIISSLLATMQGVFTAVLFVVSIYVGLLATKAGSLNNYGVFLNAAYSLFAGLMAVCIKVDVLPALCVEFGAAIRVATFVTMTSSIKTPEVRAPEYSYAIAKMHKKLSTPLAPLLFIAVAAAGATACFVRLVQTAPVACGQLEVTCTLMDGTMQRIQVAQGFDVAAGCVMPLSHSQLVDKCLAAAPAAVMRAQQHTCAIKDDELAMKFAWETAQGHTAGVTVGSPCAQLDLCANVSCPALDECHAEGKCVAGLCTTPAKADGAKCSAGVCAKGVCGSTAYVAEPVLKAATTCQTEGGALSTDMSWMTTAISDRKAALASFRRQLDTPRRALAAAASNNQQASDCDPRKGACPGYDQMYCNQPFALNYKETAVYGSHCCSELNSMSVFFSTSTMQNKVMVKFHKLNGEKFDFQTGGVNYADPLCREQAEVNMLTQHDFDTIAPLFDTGSNVAVDTRRYDAFGYPFGEKAMSAEFVLDSDAVTGCALPKARRLGGMDDVKVCMIFRGWKSYDCAGSPPTQMTGGVSGAVLAGVTEAASMLFGKFDFTEFGTSAYGSLAAPMTASAADFKAAPAAAGYDFGAQDYASVTMDFGDFQFLSLGVVVSSPPPPASRRLEEVQAPVAKASPPAAVSASVGSAGFSPHRAAAAAKLAAAAQCPKAALAKADLGDASEARVIGGTGDAYAVLAKNKDGSVSVVLRSPKTFDALSDDKMVSLEACAECKLSAVVASEWASLRANLTAALAHVPAKVSLAGHGVGAALATVAALDLNEAGVKVHELHTFGSPRVGNAAFANYYTDSAVFPHFRVTHGRDPIVHVPSASAGYSHVGREVFFNKASSSYKVCKPGEDASCALSVVMATGVDDHLSYMGENFAAKFLQCMLAPQGSADEARVYSAAAKALA